jgi:RNA polymerase sigma-70 factor (ECF subfamily)
LQPASILGDRVQRHVPETVFGGDRMKEEVGALSAAAIRSLAVPGAERGLGSVEQCFAAHHEAIYRFVYWMGADPDEAADIVQEVFVRAQRAWGTLRSRSAVRGWLLRIAGNLAKDRWKRRRREEHAVEHMGKDLASRSMVSPDDELVQSELQQQVRQAVAGLRPRWRELIILREFEGLSYEEIAQALRCGIGTVRSGLHRARADLQRRLRPYVEGDR